ncbi:MAG: Holliday junction resolvase RuvX [Rhodothermia bacterium]|nr:MAG: Holliday junction resolvase RuvX [Rhodothermia bacterium]
MDEGRLVGVDFGMKRVGLAIADPLKLFAQVFGTFDPDTALEKLSEMNEKEGVNCIVVGWPVRPDNSAGTAVQNVSEFIRRINVRLPHVEIVRWNEEYTSEVAKSLISAGEKPSMRRSGRGRIDAAAAAIILQEYLDHLPKIDSLSGSD